MRFYHINYYMLNNTMQIYFFLFFCFFIGRRKFQALRLMVLQMPIIQGTLLAILNVFNAIDTVNWNLLHACTTMCTVCAHTQTHFFSSLSILHANQLLVELIFCSSFYFQTTAIIRTKSTNSFDIHCYVDIDRCMVIANNITYDCQTFTRT